MTDTQPLVDIEAGFALQLGRVDERTARLERALRRPPAQPAFDRVFNQGAMPASGSLVLDLGGPAQGHFWYVRGLVAGGLSPTTSASGQADVFISAMDLRALANSVGLPTLGGVGLVDWHDEFQSLPNLTEYSAGVMPLRSGERLYVFFTSGTSTQVYVAAAQIQDFEEGPTRGEWSQ